MSTIVHNNYNLFLYTAICADGTYHKYSFTPKGEVHRDNFEKFLQMTDD